MLRAMAILLACLFSFSLISPALLAGDVESKLPACCRKHGKHGCVMASATHSGSTSIVKRPMRCAAYGQTTTPPVVVAATAAPTEAGYQPVAYSHPQGQAQTQALFRLALAGSAKRRGPPSSSL